MKVFSFYIYIYIPFNVSNFSTDLQNFTFSVHLDFTEPVLSSNVAQTLKVC